MSNRRAEIQQQMVVGQIAEVNKLITQLRDAVKVADMCEKGIVIVGKATAMRTVRNLEDFERRFLVGLIKEES